MATTYSEMKRSGIELRGGKKIQRKREDAWIHKDISLNKLYIDSFSRLKINIDVQDKMLYTLKVKINMI